MFRLISHPCHKARPVATWSIGIGQANRNANPLVRFGIREATSEGLFHHYRRNNGGGHLDARLCLQETLP